MADTATRQARSNSLQRMLDLEKQYMNERLRGAPVNPNQTGVTFNDLGKQQRPMSRGRQIETPTVQERRRSQHQQRSFPLQTAQPQKPQLVIDVNSMPPKPRVTAPRESQNNMKVRRSTKNIATSPPSVPYNSTVEASPPPVSGSQSSVCQSPSWEAYDRQKQEKKDEKKARDEAKAAKKPRRLSKAPPASSPYAFSQVNQSETAITNGAKKPRPASVIFSDSPSREQPFYKQPRSRAGSFSSLFKRRSSIDQSQERPFIGGIKLEYQQHLANENATDHETSGEEAEVHPAFRTSHTRSSSGPLKSPPPPPRAPSSRSYPPNTFRTAKSKSMSLVSPTAPAVPDLSTIEKWRMRIGLKTPPKSSPSSSPSQSPEPGVCAKTSSPVALSANTVTGAEETSNGENEEEKPGEPAVEQPKVVASVNQEPVRKTPLPPEPPRRSSKRNSVVLNGSPSMPLLNAALLRVPPQTASSSTYDLPSTAAYDEAKQPSASPSWENLQSSVMNTIEKTIKPMEDAKEQGEKAFWNSHEWAIHRSAFPPITSSSSEDSGSDCFNTVSMPSTPNTSRPQSEKGLPRFSSESERRTLPRIELHDNAYPSEACSFVSASSFTAAYDTDREADPIQAAARKVMAALPPMPSAKPSETRGFEQEPLRLRPKRTDTSGISDSSLMEISKLAQKNQTAKQFNGDTIAKVFVECCGCKYYHDMPSKLYDAMVNPNNVLSPKDRSEFSGTISMTVKCPWCKHAMSTNCCAGLAAMVYIKERLH